MRTLTAIVTLGAAAVPLSGCAYVTAERVSTQDHANAKGIPLYPAKTLLVVGANGTPTPVTVSDCSNPYVLRFGTVLAKNKVELDLTNGVLTKLSSDQDSTATPLKFLEIVSSAVTAGQPLGVAFGQQPNPDSKSRSFTTTAQVAVIDTGCGTTKTELSQSKLTTVTTVNFADVPAAAAPDVLPPSKVAN